MKRTIRWLLLCLPLTFFATGTADTLSLTEMTDAAPALSAEDMRQAEEAERAEWPRTFTVTVAGDTTLGSTDALRKRDDCFEKVAEAKGYSVSSERGLRRKALSPMNVMPFLSVHGFS